MQTLKVLSLLLSYPTADLQAAAGDLQKVLEKEAVLPAAHRKAVSALIEDIAKLDLIDAQERYVFLFDRTRSLSLHLFEHVHGESRDRGQAMVDLIGIYEAAGFSPTATELPDYLPLFLEFAATRPAAEAISLISEPAHVFAALRERLTRRQSPYEAAFSALLAISKAKVDEAQIAAVRREADPSPDDLEALDAAWEEEEVKFGPEAALDCGKDTLAAKLRQSRRPAPGLEVAASPPSRPIVTTSRAART